MSQNDRLVSLAERLLLEAEAEAAQGGNLIWKPEWKPTPRTRSSTVPTTARPQRRTRMSWLLLKLKSVISELKKQPSLPSLSTTPTAPASQPTLATQPAPTSQPTPVTQPAPTSQPAPASAGPAPAGPAPQALPNLKRGAVGKLVKGNNYVFRKLVNHSFPKALGRGRASLDGFRYYMIQDKYYLEVCAKMKLAAFSQANFETIKKNFSLKSSLESIETMEKTLTSMLGVPLRTIKATRQSRKIAASQKFYRATIQAQKSSEFGYYVVLLPCVLGYWKIAERLADNSVKNVVYYRAWIEENCDRSSANKYIDFVNTNINSKGGADLKKWKRVFRTACRLEAKILRIGRMAPTPFQTIANGIYFIRCSEGVVFENSDGFPVIGEVKKTGRNIQKWRLTATKRGYTIQNVQTGHFIGIPAGSGRIGARYLKAISKQRFWWINPVQNQQGNGSLSYQILESRNLRYTWTFSLYPGACIFVCDNTEKPEQKWTFERPGKSVNSTNAGGIQRRR